MVKEGLDDAEDRFICCLYTQHNKKNNNDKEDTKDAQMNEVEGDDMSKEMLKCAVVVSEYSVPEVDCPSSNIYDISLNFNSLKEKRNIKVES